MTYYSFWQPSYSGELYHYGVIGMKWGVHKARKLAALGGSDNSIVAKRNQEKYHDQITKINSKATRKLERLDRKYQKKQAKADKYFAKGERKANSLFGSKRAADKAFRKASKLQFKANKVANKGARWYEQMKKSYKKGGIPMSKANVDRGEEFIRQVRANSRAMYAASYAGG